jgi:anti-anti-sigma regulatory factor
MAPKQLEARVRQQPGAALIDLHGEITGQAAAAMSAAYAEAEQGNPEVVLLNFSGVDYINRV